MNTHLNWADLLTKPLSAGEKRTMLVRNMAPIYRMSKKLVSIETSSFGSEFTAMKQFTKYIRGLRYKLRMMVDQKIRVAYQYRCKIKVDFRLITIQDQWDDRNVTVAC